MVSSVSWMNVYSCSFRSEEHTSELQSQSNLVCRLLLEKKKNSSAHVHQLAQRQTCDHRPNEISAPRTRGNSSQPPVTPANTDPRQHADMFPDYSRHYQA